MHVAVFADIEGSFGIWRMRQCRMGTPQWQYGRMCLTQDVNHVIQGAIEGGATKVSVKDNHEVGFNILLDKLDKRAAYIGGHFAGPTFFGDISDNEKLADKFNTWNFKQNSTLVEWDAGPLES